MRILLAAATAFEIRPFIETMTREGEETGPIRQYQFNNIPIDVLVTGVGMIPMAFLMGKVLSGIHYDIAVNAGICGSFNESLVPGTVVEIVEEVIPELGSEEQEPFLDMFRLGMAKPDAWPYTNGRLVNVFRVASGILEALPHVKSATVSTIGRNREKSDRIVHRFHPDTESMEGAAFLYTCLSEKISSAQLRAVSNPVGETDRSRWEADHAIRNLNGVLVKLFENIQKNKKD
jgi:futalosine hydrolase